MSESGGRDNETVVVKVRESCWEVFDAEFWGEGLSSLEVYVDYASDLKTRRREDVLGWTKLRWEEIVRIMLVIDGWLYDVS